MCENNCLVATSYTGDILSDNRTRLISVSFGVCVCENLVCLLILVSFGLFFPCKLKFP